MRCHFCDTPLPEPGSTHIIYAEGRLHKGDPHLPLYTVCVRCLKFHKLKMRRLVGR